MDESMARGWAARALVVLSLLVGLLAMHGLASTHHTAAAAPGAGHEAAAVSDAQHDHDGASGSAAAQDMPALAPSLAAPSGPSCDPDCSPLALLCLAILTGAVLALLRARGRHPWLLLAPARRRARAPSPTVRQPEGPDPVRELCVSRT